MMLMLSLLSLVWSVAPTRTAGQEPSPADTARVTVTVDGAHPWVDSGLVVHKGERLVFKADGTIRWGDKPDQVTGPDGKNPKPGRVGVGGLIGRVGYNGKPFSIGNARVPVIMPKEGKLFLGINDFVFRDNAGSFTVTIFTPADPAGAHAGRDSRGQPVTASTRQTYIDTTN